ncbi:MAG: hypothetical protein WAL83_02085, partial [Arenicellales bacterium]
VRPVAPDGLPMVGPVPGCQNAHVVLGGGVKGLLLSSGLGRTVAAMVMKQEQQEDQSFLSPGRFAAQGVAALESAAGVGAAFP